MNAPRCCVAVLFCLAVVIGVTGVRADPTAQSAKPKTPQKPVLHDDDFRGIVEDANRYIQDALAKGRKAAPKPTDAHGYSSTVRSNTLLIALAAQNRMGDPDADAKPLATLRDAAVSLADAVEQKPPDFDKVLRLADLLNQYPKLKADPNAKTGRVRLKDTFRHGDITSLLGGCSGKSGHAIESQMLALARKRLPYSEADEAKIERLAYKVALLVDLTKEFDAEHTPPEKPGLQKEWVRMAGEVETAAWTLADAARVSDHDDIKKKLGTLFSLCASCHVKFRN
jgi:cytochrome c556